jgi:Phosphotransferase enzyme family
VSAEAKRRTEDLVARASMLWSAVDPGAPPDSVEVLKSADRKSAVVRLVGSGPDGQSVVAKRAARATIEVEARVYRDVLARLPVSGTRLFGTVPEGDRAWLFLEDAGEERFDSGLLSHRRLAAVWMAQVHGGARLLPEVDELPDRNPSHYRRLLRSVEALLRETPANPALSAGEIEVVEDLLQACRSLRSRWSDLAMRLRDTPSTIAFGGFCGKNARVRESADGPVLMPFDFESAGHGCPAIDLVYPDGDTYVQEARSWWTGLDIAEFNRLQGVGSALGAMKAIQGERSVLLGEWPSKAIEKLFWYRREIVDGMSAAGLDNGAAATFNHGSWSR